MGTIEELKTELESKTDFRFEFKDGFFGKELRLLGLNKKSEVKIHLSHYTKTGELFYSFSARTKSSSYEGFGAPCEIVGLVIEKIEQVVRNADYGYKQPDLNKQISLFGGGK